MTIVKYDQPFATVNTWMILLNTFSNILESQCTYHIDWWTDLEVRDEILELLLELIPSLDQALDARNFHPWLPFVDLDPTRRKQSWKKAYDSRVLNVYSPEQRRNKFLIILLLYFLLLIFILFFLLWLKPFINHFHFHSTPITPSISPVVVFAAF